MSESLSNSELFAIFLSQSSERSLLAPISKSDKEFYQNNFPEVFEASYLRGKDVRLNELILQDKSRLREFSEQCDYLNPLQTLKNFFAFFHSKDLKLVWEEGPVLKFFLIGDSPAEPVPLHWCCDFPEPVNRGFFEQLAAFRILSAVESQLAHFLVFLAKSKEKQFSLEVPKIILEKKDVSAPKSEVGISNEPQQLSEVSLNPFASNLNSSMRAKDLDKANMNPFDKTLSRIDDTQEIVKSEIVNETYLPDPRQSKNTSQPSYLNKSSHPTQPLQHSHTVLTKIIETSHSNSSELKLEPREQISPEKSGDNKPSPFSMIDDIDEDLLGSFQKKDLVSQNASQRSNQTSVYSLPSKFIDQGVSQNLSKANFSKPIEKNQIDLPSFNSVVTESNSINPTQRNPNSNRFEKYTGPTPFDDDFGEVEEMNQSSSLPIDNSQILRHLQNQSSSQEPFSSKAKHFEESKIQEKNPDTTSKFLDDIDISWDAKVNQTPQNDTVRENEMKKSNSIEFQELDNLPLKVPENFFAYQNPFYAELDTVFPPVYFATRAHREDFIPIPLDLIRSVNSKKPFHYIDEDFLYNVESIEIRSTVLEPQYFDIKLGFFEDKSKILKINAVEILKEKAGYSKYYANRVGESDKIFQVSESFTTQPILKIKISPKGNVKDSILALIWVVTLTYFQRPLLFTLMYFRALGRELSDQLRFFEKAQEIFVKKIEIRTIPPEVKNLDVFLNDLEICGDFLCRFDQDISLLPYSSSKGLNVSTKGPVTVINSIIQESSLKFDPNFFEFGFSKLNDKTKLTIFFNYKVGSREVLFISFYLNRAFSTASKALKDIALSVLFHCVFANFREQSSTFFTRKEKPEINIISDKLDQDFKKVARFAENEEAFFVKLNEKNSDEKDSKKLKFTYQEDKRIFEFFFESEKIVEIKFRCFYSKNKAIMIGKREFFNYLRRK